jgi:hypothetical protein
VPTSRVPSASPRSRSRNPHGSYLGAKYRRITSRRGLSIAIVAIERAILVIIGQMSRTRAFYQDLGVDHYTRPDPERVNDGPSNNSPTGLQGRQ